MSLSNGNRPIIFILFLILILLCSIYYKIVSSKNQEYDDSPPLEHPIPPKVEIEDNSPLNEGLRVDKQFFQKCNYHSKECFEIIQEKWNPGQFNAEIWPSLISIDNSESVNHSYAEKMNNFVSAFKNYSSTVIKYQQLKNNLSKIFTDFENSKPLCQRNIIQLETSLVDLATLENNLTEINNNFNIHTQNEKEMQEKLQNLENVFRSNSTAFHALVTDLTVKIAAIKSNLIKKDTDKTLLENKIKLEKEENNKHSKEKENDETAKEEKTRMLDKLLQSLTELESEFDLFKIKNKECEILIDIKNLMEPSGDLQEIADKMKKIKSVESEDISAIPFKYIQGKNQEYAANEEMRALVENCAEFEKQFQHLQKKIQDLKQQIDDIKKEITKISNNINTLIGKINATENSIAKKECEIQEFINDIKELEDKKIQSENELNSIQELKHKTIDLLNANIKQLKDDLLHEKNKLTNLENQKLVTTKQISLTKAHIDSLGEETQDHCIAALKSKNNYAHKNSKHLGAKDIIAQQNTQIINLISELEDLLENAKKMLVEKN